MPPRPRSPTPTPQEARAAGRWNGAPQSAQRRRARELATIRVMIRMYCRDHHRAPGLCDGCAALASYAERRLERCVFGPAKPTCANCTVHCYSADMRERVRTVMRYAGPRMLLSHPILGIAHLIDGRRPAPALPQRPPQPGASPGNADAGVRLPG